MEKDIKRIRAVSILIDQNKVLLIFRKFEGKEYYTFPGGGLEPNETIEQAVLRELFEETTLRAEIDKLLYVHEYDDDSEQYFYLLKKHYGTPKLHQASIEKQRNSEQDYYEPRWVDINDLTNIRLYPLEIRDWFIEDVKNNFVNCPRKQFIKISERRD
ncbi:MAG: NUDIX domain-containing protein [Candidatus Uhrbacteria bacterium]|nr:NUDIX domain-containing protein [Patescibacteria group bacterium]MBU1906855.1 NUDIX domain-containing protein [Patescibacteria group bacterium]